VSVPDVSGSKAFARMILNGQFEEALAVAHQQVENGAQIIDINMDEAMLDSRSRHGALLEPDRVRARYRPRADHDRQLQVERDRGRSEAASRARAIVNSISMKEGEDEFKRQAKLMRRYGAAAVVMAFDEKGQADTYQRKVEICERAYRVLVRRGGLSRRRHHLRPEHLRHRHRHRRARQLRGRLHRGHRAGSSRTCRGAKVIGGVSNVSFSFRGNDPVREAIHTVFLYHAIEAGMDMGIVNAGMVGVYDDLEPQSARAGRRRGAESPRRRGRTPGGNCRNRQERRQGSRVKSLNGAAPLRRRWLWPSA